MEKVRVNALYVYTAGALIDRISPPAGQLEAGDIVRVVNLPGCPRANVMRHCYVNQLDGVFGGLVCVGSLRQLTPAERRAIRGLCNVY